MDEDGDLHDEDVRLLELAWRKGNDPADGERWVVAVLRATGAPILPMISLMISHHRALRGIGQRSASVGTGGISSEVRAGFQQPVMPEDIVDFLQGKGEFARAVVPAAEPPTPVALVVARGEDALTPYCDPCGSYHVVPLTAEHHIRLGCRGTRHYSR